MTKVEPKQVIVIRKDLSMRKGKIAAQAAHASLKAVLNFAHWSDKESMSLVLMPKPMIEWLKGRFKKICVYVTSEEALVDVYNRAKAKDIPCSLITDAGLTEFDGIPTKTAVAVGPYHAVEVDKITNKLHLL